MGKALFQFIIFGVITVMACDYLGLPFGVTMALLMGSTFGLFLMGAQGADRARRDRASAMRRRWREGRR